MHRNEYSLQEDNMMETQDIRKTLPESVQSPGHTDSSSKPSPLERTDSGYRKSVYKSVELLFSS